MALFTCCIMLKLGTPLEIRAVKGVLPPKMLKTYSVPVDELVLILTG